MAPTEISSTLHLKGNGSRPAPGPAAECCTEDLNLQVFPRKLCCLSCRSMSRPHQAAAGQAKVQLANDGVREDGTVALRVRQVAVTIPIATPAFDDPTAHDGFASSWSMICHHSPSGHRSGILK